MNLVLYAQCSFYLLLFVFSFFTCVPSGVNVSDFSGSCLLYTEGSWKTTASNQSEPANFEWGPDSACNFTVFIGVISLIISLFYCIWVIIMIVRTIECTWLETFINMLVNVILCICFFATALTVSVGFRQWCKFVTDPKSGMKNCEDGQVSGLGLYLGVDSHRYFNQWQIVQFGVWSCWILWLTLTVISVVKMLTFHRQEAFMTSVSRERERLLAQVGQRTVPA